MPHTTTEKDYIDHWNNVVDNEEVHIATHDEDYKKTLEACRRANEYDAKLLKQSWIVDFLPLEGHDLMTKDQVRQFLEKWSNDSHTDTFTVVFIGDDDKQHRHKCYPLTVGSQGYSGAPIDPWAKGDDICIATDFESCNGKESFVCDTIEFNMNKVVSIVTCERFKQIQLRKFGFATCSVPVDQEQSWYDPHPFVQ